jgi:signal transduction histidine kinase
MYVNFITSSATEYLQVIEKSLDFSKLDAGQLAIDNLSFELAPMVKGVESVIRPKAMAKKLALRCTLDAAVTPRFLGDERRVRQCLLHLLDNAVKFTNKGQIDLTVTVVHLQGQTPTLRFQVTDTGIGLTDSDRVRLFHPFVQGDGSTTRRYGGIGLGLIICQQMVTLMQGHLGVQSTPGEGSTFWFELPLRATP